MSLQNDQGENQCPPKLHPDVSTRPEKVQVDCSQELGYKWFRGVVVSDAMRHKIDKMEHVIYGDLPIHIWGETGTGKEVVARSVHEASRKGKPFIWIQCGAEPETLFESIVFGHTKGSFSGAYRNNPGLLEAAKDGTVFIDEINSSPLAVQQKLLRFVREGEYRRVGESTTRHSTARILTASNENLKQLIRTGRFREDLYYRITGHIIRMAPLRKRIETIWPLFSHFIKLEAQKLGFQAPVFENVEDIRGVLVSHTWHGNAGELQNVAANTAHYYAHNPGHAITADVVREIVDWDEDEPVGTQTLDDTIRRKIECELVAKDGNVSAAARALGINESSLRSRSKKLGISLDRFKT